MDYLWFGLLILGLVTIFGTLASAFVFAGCYTVRASYPPVNGKVLRRSPIKDL